MSIAALPKICCRGWPFTFCCPLLWKTRRSIIICGRGKEARNSCGWLENDSSMPLWTPKGTQVINMSRSKMAALLMVPFFLLSSAMVVSCVSLLWCKDAVMAGQQEQNGEGARHCSIVHLLLLYYSGHDGRIHQRKRRDFFALGAVAAFTSRQRKRHYRMADRQRSGRRDTRHLSNSLAFIGNEDSRTFE